MQTLKYPTDLQTTKLGGVRIEVVNHSNVSDTTLVRLLDTKVSKRGVVDHAAYKKLIERGVKIDADMKLNVNQE